MMRTLPFLMFLVGCGGSDALLMHYTVNIHVDPSTELGQGDLLVAAIPPCANAEVFDQTLRVYEGMIEEPVAAVTLSWGGVDLTNGGDNQLTTLLTDGETASVYAALRPDLLLYEFDWKGNMVQLDKDVANVKGKSEAEIDYGLGVTGGANVYEHHVLADEADEVLFVEEGVYNCDITL